MTSLECVYELEHLLSDRNVALEETTDYHLVPSDENVLSGRPWRTDPKYFDKARISAVALMKMAVHAKLGGSIEVMGMLTGKIVQNTIVVMDVYSLPVEGTETRVNAQAEAYEYMVQYLENLKQIGQNVNIVGWYHSHPGYGCWLSGIDVATQKLNQDFQDPYLAIVVDPVRTVNLGTVDVGAFRAYPDNYKEGGSEKDKIKGRKEFGSHADRYYSLDVSIFTSSADVEVLRALRSESWMSELLKTDAQEQSFTSSQLEKVNSFLHDWKTQQQDRAVTRFHVRSFRKFRLGFDETIQEKLNSCATEKRIDFDEDAMDTSDSSDYEKQGLDISDDALSVESSTSPRRQNHEDMMESRKRDKSDAADDLRINKQIRLVEARNRKRLQLGPTPKAPLSSLYKGLGDLENTAREVGAAELNNYKLLKMQQRIFR